MAVNANTEVASFEEPVHSRDIYDMQYTTLVQLRLAATKMFPGQGYSQLTNSTNIIQGIYTKHIPLDSLDVLLPNDTIHVLYNLYYVGQFGNLGMHTAPVNKDRGSTCHQ
jgi:hypothetical protein